MSGGGGEGFNLPKDAAPREVVPPPMTDKERAEYEVLRKAILRR